MIRVNDGLPVPADAIAGVSTAPLPHPAEVIEKLGLWRRPLSPPGDAGV